MFIWEGLDWNEGEPHQTLVDGDYVELKIFPLWKIYEFSNLCLDVYLCLVSICWSTSLCLSLLANTIFKLLSVFIENNLCLH